MWLRRAFFWWLFPAALILPVWLLVGWIAFGGGGWALVWVLFLAMPSVFLAQLVLGLLVRARSSVRAARAVSWWDVAGFGVWHALVMVVGTFPAAWFGVALVASIVAAIALFWLTLWQLWSEAKRGARTLLHAADATGYLPPQQPRHAQPAEGEVIVITERPPRD